MNNLNQAPADEFKLPLTEDMIQEETRRFMIKVYNWMAFGLALTGLVAMGMASKPELVMAMVSKPIIFYGLLIGEVVMVIAFVGLAQRISANACIGLFLAYAAVNGLTLSTIFLIYTQASITSTFFITAGTFAAMSAFGYFTKRDLSGLGHFLFMGLIGLIIASVVNIFLKSPMMYWVTTYAGVIIFVGLTAYDTQKIKKMNRIGNEGTEEDRKEAIIGALILYLDFINLFLYLLRIFGKRR